MSDKPFVYGPNNPHPLSQMRTKLVWDGKYDEYAFVKGYDKLRANGILLAADIKKSCGKLKRAIEGKAKKLLKNDGQR